MIQLLILLAVLAGGDLEGRLPDNTILVLSAKPRALAETPAFMEIKKNFRRLPGIGPALADLDKLAGIDFFRDVEEISLVLPVDFELRKSAMVLIRGDFRLGGLLALAEAHKMEIEDSEAAGGCILSIPGGKGLAIGILEDGTLLIASRKTIERHGRGGRGPRKERLSEPINAALNDADWDAMIWGALSLPGTMAAAAGAGSGLPLGHVERVHFEVDAAVDFFVTVQIALKDTMKPAEFIKKVKKQLAITQAAPSRKEKEKKGKVRVAYVRRGGWLPENLEIGESEKNGVTVSFRITTKMAKEFLASLAPAKGD